MQSQLLCPHTQTESGQTYIRQNKNEEERTFFT